MVDGNEITLSGWRRNKAIKVLLYLLLSPHHRIPTDHLFYLLWPRRSYNKKAGGAYTRPLILSGSTWAAANYSPKGATSTSLRMSGQTSESLKTWSVSPTLRLIRPRKKNTSPGLASLRGASFCPSSPMTSTLRNTGDITSI